MKKAEKNLSILNLELDRFEEDKAVLFTENDKEIILPREIIPVDVTEGATLVMTLMSEEAETSRKEKKAREILNEILNIEPK